MRLVAVLLLLFLAAANATAANYVFPGTLPAGCSGSGPSYTCAALTLNWDDKITINSPKPATITVNGNFSTSNARINHGGAASDLTLIVKGSLTTGSGAWIVANVQTTSNATLGGAGQLTGTLDVDGNLQVDSRTRITDNVRATGSATTGWESRIDGTLTAASVSGGGAVTYGNTVTATTGALSIGANASTVTGNVVASAGSVSIGNTAVVNGNVTAATSVALVSSSRVNGNVAAGSTLNIENAARVTGNVQATGAATLASQTRIDGTTTVGALTDGGNGTFGGSITANTGAITVGGSSTVAGNVTATVGMVSIAGSSTVTGNVTANAGAVSITGRVNGDVTAGGNLTLASSARITGNASASGAATVAWQGRIDGTTTVGSLSGGGEATYGGAITATTGAISLGGSSQVGGDVTAKVGSITLADSVKVTGNVFAEATSGGTLTLQNSSRVNGCAMTNSTAASSISLAWHANPGGVCCASGGSCLPTSNACYSNNSDYSISTDACSSLLPPATLIAQYRMEDAGWNGTSGELKDTAGYTGGPFNGVAIGTPVPTPTFTAPAKSGSTGTCGYATMPGLAANGGAFSIPSLPVSTVAGAKTSVAFWMHWDGTFGVMPIGWSGHDLYFSSGYFGFNTANSDIYGIASAGLTGWHHVVAVFTNGSVTSNELYIDGVRQTLSQRLSTPTNANAVVNTTLRVGGWARDTSYRFTGLIDEVKVYNGAVTQAQVTALHSETHACPATVVAEWRMDELAWSGAAGEVVDAVANGYHGQSVDGASTMAGKICQGGDFRFQSTASQYDRVRLDDRALNGLGDFSISVWVKTPSANGGAFMSILSGANASLNNEALLGIENSRISAHIHNTQAYLSNALNIFDNNWHHLVWTRSGTNHCAYVDGAPALCATINGTSAALNVAGGGLIVGQDQDAVGGNFDVNQDWEGQIDELMVFSGALTTAEVAAGYANQNAGRNWIGTARSCPVDATLIAQYRMEDTIWNGTSGELKDTAGYAGGPFNGVAIGTPVPTPTFTAPAKSGSTGTCGYATMPGLAANGGAFSIPNLPVSIVAGAKTSVAFWMHWDGTFGVMPIGWSGHDLYFSSGYFGFNTANSDIYGIASAGLTGWHHVVAVFTNGSVTSNELYIDGVRQTLSQRLSTPTNANAVVNTTLRVGGWALNTGYRFTGRIDEVKVYNGAVTQAQVTALHSETHACPATVVAEWRMDELAWNGVAGEVQDSAGSNHATAKEYTSLTPLLGLPTTENAKLCKGGRFRGDWNESPVQGHANFYLDAPDADSLSPLVDSREMTLAGWFKLSSESGTILYKGEGWTAQEYQVYSSGGGKLTAIAWDKWGHSVSLDIPGVTVGKWHFFAVTITATGTSASMVGHLFDESGRVGGPVSPGVLSNPGSFDISGKTTPGSFVMGMGKTTTTTFGSPMTGWLDEIKVVDRALTQSQIEAGWANESAGKNWNGTARSCPVAATLIAQYRMEDAGWNGTSGELKDTAGYTGGPFNGVAIGAPVPTPTLTAPAKSGSPGTCGYATMPGPAGNGGAFSIPNLPVSTVAGAKTSVAFWMYWNGTFGVMPIGWSGHDLWLSGGSFGFNTASSDIYGIASAGLAGGWHHVVAVFTNGSVTSNELYIDGVRQPLTQRTGTPSNTSALVQPTLRVGGWARDTGYRFTGRIDEVKVYNGAVTQAQVTALHSETHDCMVVAEWRMDELAWNGTAGEVQDSSGNNLNGWTVAGASTASAKICQGGVFDNQSYAEIPDSAALQLATAYSVAAWIKTDKASGTIVSKTAASSPWSGYVFAIGPDSGGKLALWNGTGSWNTSSGAAVNDGAWHHVVASVNGTSLQFYVDGAPNGSAIALSGTTTASTSPLRIGYENNAGGASRYFSGQIDEVMIFKAALTTAEVAAGYANQNAGKNWNGTARSCPTSFDHIRIEHNGTGLTCQREPVKIKACKDATCTALSTESVSLKLSPTGKWWPVATGGTQTDAVTLASGTATVYLQSSAAGTVTVGAIDVAPDPHPASGDKVKCYNGTTQTCDIVFADAGLIFTESNATDAEATIPTQTSGKASGNYYLRAVKTDNTSGTCTAAVDGSRTVAFSYACVDPNACIADKMTIANTAVASSGTNVTLVFDANGYSPAFTFRFDDAGKIGLGASTTSSTGGALKGSSNSFVVKPAGLCVSTDVAACTAAAGEEHTCAKATKAGEAFNLTVRGVTWESDTDSDLCTAGNVTTPNYKAKAIALGHELVAPSGGAAGSVGVASLDIDADGKATINQSVSEVGVFKFKAAPPAYFGKTIGSPPFWTGALGRFYPAKFSVAANTPALANGCTTGNFTYLDQPFGFATKPELTLTAQNTAGGTTTNYGDSFWKLADPPSLAASAFANAATGTTDFSRETVGTFVLAGQTDYDGVGTLTASDDKLKYARPATGGQAPFTGSLNLTIPASSLTDADGVCYDADTDGACDAWIFSGVTGVALRHGRARLLNANGSELLRLPLPLRLEYFSGATQGWQTNAADTCTTIAADNFAFAFPAGTTAKPNNLAACETEMTMSGSAPNYTLTLEAPGAGNTGWTNVTLNLGAAAAGGSCTVVGAATATTATAPWLRYNWTGAEDNPTARATFGVFRSGPVIHMREFY